MLALAVFAASANQPKPFDYVLSKGPIRGSGLPHLPNDLRRYTMGVYTGVEWGTTIEVYLLPEGSVAAYGDFVPEWSAFACPQGDYLRLLRFGHYYYMSSRLASVLLRVLPPDAAPSVASALGENRSPGSDASAPGENSAAPGGDNSAPGDSSAAPDADAASASGDAAPAAPTNDELCRFMRLLYADLIYVLRQPDFSENPLPAVLPLPR